MGLDDFVKEESESNEFKKYNLHQKDEEVEKIAERFKDDLPDDFQMDFIEASPAMKSGKTWVYHRENDQGDDVFFIRVAEQLFQNRKQLERRVKISMINLYVFQQDVKLNGPENTDEKMNRKATLWIAGKLGISCKGYIDELLWETTCSKI